MAPDHFNNIRRHRSRELLGLLTIFAPIIVLCLFTLFEILTTASSSSSLTSPQRQHGVVPHPPPPSSLLEMATTLVSDNNGDDDDDDDDDYQQQQYRIDKMNEFRSSVFHNDPFTALIHYIVDQNIRHHHHPPAEEQEHEEKDGRSQRGAENIQILKNYHIQQREEKETALHIHIAVSATISIIAFFITPLILYASLWICHKFDECWSRRNRNRRNRSGSVRDYNDTTTRLRIRREEQKKLVLWKQHIQNELQKMCVILPRQRQEQPATTAETTITSTVPSEGSCCPICLEQFLSFEQAIVSNSCGCTRNKTIFHQSCAEQWLLKTKQNPQHLCPCCRFPMISSLPHLQ